MNPPDPVQTGAASAPSPPRSRRPQAALIIAVLAALLLAVQWYDNHRQMKMLQTELARRLAAADVENRGATEQVRETARDAQSRLAVLEAAVQELGRGREESLLADIEQTLLAANQQVQLSGNTRAALLALQSVEARLARTDRAQFAGLRKSVAADIARLKDAPRVDFVAVAARLDEVAASLQGLPLLIEARPSDAPGARRPPPPAADPWLRFAREFWQDVRDLVRIERIDNADVVALSVSQAYFLRENLRLRLLGARVALIARNEKIYKADLAAARDWLTRYFDVRQEAVARTVASLRQLHDSAVSIELPDAAASLDAVRSVRAPAERR